MKSLIQLLHLCQLSWMTLLLLKKLEETETGVIVEITAGTGIAIETETETETDRGAEKGIEIERGANHKIIKILVIKFVVLVS